MAPPLDVAEVHHRFEYVPPDANRVKLHEEVRRRLIFLAETLAELLPESREKSLAVTALEEAGFWANAAIARNVPDQEVPHG